MASFGVLNPQLVSSNTTQDKNVKQNTFVLQVRFPQKEMRKLAQNHEK